MKFFRFCYRQNEDLLEDKFTQYNQYCNFLQTMYEHYFKPIKTGKISCMEIIFFEKGKVDNVETTGRKTIFINYNYKNLLDKSVVEIHRILFEEIQNHIINCVKENNWNEEPFRNVYTKITGNKYLFEEKYLKSFSNKIYKAQIVFKYDYQDSGVFLGFYNKNKLINKVRFSNNGMSIINIGEREWINENTVRIYYIVGTVKNIKKYYWEINANGTVDFNNTNKNDPQELYNLGIMYYEGWGAVKNLEKGIELIKRSAKMGYKHGKNWVNKNIK